MDNALISSADSGLASPRVEAVKAGPLQLSASLTVGQAFQAVAINCLTQIQANADGVRQQDGESVHQMRVGLRRLRLALAIFQSLLFPTDPLREELGWLTEQLGLARDWDILAGPIVDNVATALEDPLPVAAIRKAASIEAEKHYQLAAAAVSSERYQQLSAALTRWVENRHWHDSESTTQRKQRKNRLPDFADTVLAHYRHSLVKQGKWLPEATARKRHKVRIAAKKMRYATEFFQSLYKAKARAPFVAALVDLQDVLGKLNDAASAGRLLQELPAINPALSESAGYIRGYLAAAMRHEQGTVFQLWQKFERIKLPSAS